MVSAVGSLYVVKLQWLWWLGGGGGTGPLFFFFNFFCGGVWCVGGVCFVGCMSGGVGGGGGGGDSATFHVI